MIALRSVAWEVRHAYRDAVPQGWLRWLLLGAALAWEIFLVTYAIRSPATPERPLEIGVVVGFFGLNLLLAAITSGVATASVLARPERLRSLALSPIAPSGALLLLLSPALLAALVPVTLLLLPFAGLVAARSPLVALGMAAAAVAALGWAVSLVFVLARVCARRLGRERGARTLRALSIYVGMGTLLVFRKVARLEVGTAVAGGFLLASPLLLPLFISRASRGFIGVLQTGQVAGRSPEPVWGEPGWARALWRSLSSVVGLIALIPGVSVAVVRPELRPALLGMFVFVVASAPLDRLLEAEWAPPARLRLAPLGKSYERRLLLQCGGLSVFAALGASVALGWGHWRWLGAVSLVAAAVPFTFLVPARLARRVLQFVLYLAATFAAALWAH